MVLDVLVFGTGDMCGELGLEPKQNFKRFYNIEARQHEPKLITRVWLQSLRGSRNMTQYLGANKYLLDKLRNIPAESNGVPVLYTT